MDKMLHFGGVVSKKRQTIDYLRKINLKFCTVQGSVEALTEIGIGNIPGC
jgi:hypothetical protein